MVTSLRLFTLNELTSRRFRSKGLLAPPLFDACVDSAPRLAHFSPPLPRHPSCPGFPSPESRRRTLGHGVRRRYSFSSLISSDIFIRLPFDFPSLPSPCYSYSFTSLSPSLSLSFLFFIFYLFHNRFSTTTSPGVYTAAIATPPSKGGVYTAYIQLGGSRSRGRGCSHCLFSAPAYIPPRSSFLLCWTGFPWSFLSTSILLPAPTPLA